MKVGIIYLLFSFLFIDEAARVDKSTSSYIENMIEWRPDRKLTWDDYKGTPNTESPFNAESSLQISYGMSIRDDGRGIKIKFDVKCSFDIDESWVKPGSKSDRLLKHEQLHFDIAEIYARKLRLKLEKNTFDAKNYQKKSQSIFQENFDEYTRFQDKYDEETNHGLKQDIQELWDARISKALEDSKKYQKK
ncbi:DUF922 domain-containing protein [Fulvivirgaceae bacterium BMA10]|uniref:DUF922 domain-containing protein n=1 Tax=Splendidivirga corallicola TaxID=3051826 RepID=A0ABT8KH60_9BACT|nr:DUF922 domain-containing protein [Fulvivirgaceae bacterium BMA10]